MKAPVDPGALETWERSLWQQVGATFLPGLRSMHGPSHWRRVRRNGLALAVRSGADVAVVRLFALFHDSRRVNDLTDPGHGARGAQHASEARHRGLFVLSDTQFDRLHEACSGHTDGFHHADPTIGTCWDADRLDLGRCGMVLDAEFMSTDFAREIAGTGSIEPFLADVNLAPSHP